MRADRRRRNPACTGSSARRCEAPDCSPRPRYRYQLAAVNEHGRSEPLDETGGSGAAGRDVHDRAGARAAGEHAARRARSAATPGDDLRQRRPRRAARDVQLRTGRLRRRRHAVRRRRSPAPPAPAARRSKRRSPLSGLQPGTTYAFRIAVHSGYIHNGENTLRGAAVPVHDRHAVTSARGARAARAARDPRHRLPEGGEDVEEGQEGREQAHQQAEKTQKRARGQDEGKRQGQRQVGRGWARPLAREGLREDAVSIAATAW